MEAAPKVSKDLIGDLGPYLAKSLQRFTFIGESAAKALALLQQADKATGSRKASVVIQLRNMLDLLETDLRLMQGHDAKLKKLVPKAEQALTKY